MDSKKEQKGDKMGNKTMKEIWSEEKTSQEVLEDALHIAEELRDMCKARKRHLDEVMAQIEKDLQACNNRNKKVGVR